MGRYNVDRAGFVGHIFSKADHGRAVCGIAYFDSVDLRRAYHGKKAFHRSYFVIADFCRKY